MNIPYQTIEEFHNIDMRFKHLLPIGEVITVHTDRQPILVFWNTTPAKQFVIYKTGPHVTAGCPLYHPIEPSKEVFCDFPPASPLVPITFYVETNGILCAAIISPRKG